ncbi:hypothetical protein YB2330_000309 [Saitoella coloradoensis]
MALAEQALTDSEFKGIVDPQPWFVRKRREVAYEHPGTPSLPDSYFQRGDEDTSSVPTIRWCSKNEDEDEDEPQGEDYEEQSAAAAKTSAKHLHEKAVQSGFATSAPAPVGKISSTFESHARPVDDEGFQRVMMVRDPDEP